MLDPNPGLRLDCKAVLAHPWLKSRSEQSNTPLPATVVEALQSFGKMNKLKQTAIDIVAFSLTPNQMKALRATFNSMDSDSSGVVSLKEFRRAIRDAEGEKKMKRAEIDKMFKSIDRDNSKTISYSEFLAAALDRQNYLTDDRLRAAFERLDVDKTGDISLEDLKTVMGDMYDEQSLTEMIAKADPTPDGKIHYEEFLEIMHGAGVGNDEEKAQFVQAVAAAGGGDDGGLADVKRPSGASVVSGEGNTAPPAAAKVEG
jgi:calcium-dependent protein kinase